MRIVFALLLGVSLTSATFQVCASSSMASGFIDMMDAMADAYTRYRGNNRKGYSWRDEMPNMSGISPGMMGMPGMTGMGMMPNFQSGVMSQGFPSLFSQIPEQFQGGQLASPSVLEGWWLGQSGEVLAFKRNRFRIYVGPDDWREGKFLVQDWRLSMTDPANGKERHYEFALMDRYLALRNLETGDILYYVSVDG